jgi:hypothetical protein
VTELAHAMTEVAHAVNDEAHAVAREAEKLLHALHEELTKWPTSGLSRVLFRESIAKIMRLGLSPRGQSAIAPDPESGHCFDMIELREVLAQAHTDAGMPFELLGMDACLMSNVEVGFECAEHARFVVGSEGKERPAGWPLDQVLRSLARSPGMDGRNLGKAIVGEYAKCFSPRVGDFTQAVTESAKISSLVDPLNALAAALKTHPFDAEPAQGTCAKFSYEAYQLVDLGSFCRKLLTKGTAEQVRSAAAAVLGALKPGGYVVANTHDIGSEVRDCAGVTIYLPPPSHFVPAGYGDLLFAQQTSWLDFLNAYVGSN